MGMLKTAARTKLLDQPRLDALFGCLNQVMPAVKEAHMYATCAALRIGPRAADGTFPVEYAVAGHPPIVRIDAETGGVEYFSDEQFPLGLLPAAEYCSSKFCCRTGDLLAVTTDGVLEVENDQNVEFGFERLEALLREGREEELLELASRILQKVNAFGQQNDDQTLLLIRL